MKLFLSTEIYDPLSVVIRWNTRCAWSHAGFLDEKTGCTYSAMIAGGVRWRPPIPKALGLMLEVPRCREAFEWAWEQNRKPYDWRAIMGMAMDRNWETKNRWFCSELVAAAFEQIGQPLLNPNAPVWRITPRDLLLSPLVTIGRQFRFADYLQ